jgi:hypothetical protein
MVSPLHDDGGLKVGSEKPHPGSLSPVSLIRWGLQSKIQTLELQSSMPRSNIQLYFQHPILSAAILEINALYYRLVMSPSWLTIS